MNTSRRDRSIGHQLVPLLLLLSIAVPANAQNLLTNALDHYLRAQTKGLPGEVTYSIGQIDPRTQLAPCSAYEPFLPNGSRLWGKTTVGVRCLAPSTWTVYVPVQISVSGYYLVAARSIAAGQQLSDADILTRKGDLSSLPTSILTDPAQAIGKTMKIGTAVGQPLRSDALIAPWAVQQGQNVKLLTKGSGFSVSSEGRSLNNAIEGQIVQVRTTSGQSVSGIARAGGVVEISY